MKKEVLFHLLRKELVEAGKQHRLLIILITFLFFGILSPVTALYMPQLLHMIGAQQGMIIEVQQPSVTDSLLHFHKNIAQAALFIMMFLFMGVVAQEKERGTAAFLLVKPVSRDIWILAKFLAVFIQLGTGIVIAAVSCALYTQILFGSLPLAALCRVSCLLFVYLLTIISLTFLFSTLCQRQMTAGLGTFLVWLLLEGASMVPILGKFLPGKLSAEAQAAVFGMSIDLVPILGSCTLIGICVFGSLVSFRRWE